jgi:protease-4
VHGVIADEAAQFVRQAVRSLSHNKPAAIVLRVDSPGGSVSASDRIWNELKNFRKENSGVPIVASYGGVAASGGYYISCGADHIVAEPTTITGSIGVIAQGFTLERLLDKIGVTPEVQHSDRATMKDSLSPMRKWGPQDHELLADILNAAHARFVAVVAEGRKGHLTLAQIEANNLDSGAPFTTAEAIKNNLIDQEGYLSDAIDKAAALANLPVGTAQVTVIGHQPSLFAKLMSSRQEGIDLRAVDSRQVRQMMDDLATPAVEYRWYPWH